MHHRKKKKTFRVAYFCPWMVRKSRASSVRNINNEPYRTLLSHHTWPFLQMLMFGDVLWVVLLKNQWRHSSEFSRKEGSDHEDTNWYDSLHCRAQLPAGFSHRSDSYRCFSLPVLSLNVKPELWRHSSSSVKCVPAKLGSLFLGSVPPHKPLPKEQCHALAHFGF